MMHESHRGSSAGGAPAVPLAVRPGGDSLAITIVAVSSAGATVRLQGELDYSTAGSLAAVLADQRAHGYRFLRLDVSGLAFLDCAAVGVIVAAHQAALAAPGTLVLSGAGGPVARLLSLTGLDAVLCAGRIKNAPQVLTRTRARADVARVLRGERLSR